MGLYYFEAVVFRCGMIDIIFIIGDVERIYERSSRTGYRIYRRIFRNVSPSVESLYFRVREIFLYIFPYII